MKKKIIDIIGHGIEPERAELKADEIIELFNKEQMNNIDGAFAMGCFNVGGIDGLINELNRLKELGHKPHHVFLRMQK